jgi:hypothetical protein
MMLLLPSAWNSENLEAARYGETLGIPTNFHGVILQKINLKLVLRPIISYFRGFQHKYNSNLEAGKCKLRVRHWMMFSDRKVSFGLSVC